jgi:hypothetical protein
MINSVNQQKLIRGDKEGHYILAKGTIQQVLNIYALNIDAQAHETNNSEHKEQIGTDAIIMRDLNTPLSSTDRTSRQKINKDILELNNTMYKMDVTGIYRICHPMTTDHTFTLAAHGTFLKIDHILDHKENFNKYRKPK